MEIFGSYPLNAANKNSKNRRGTIWKEETYFEAVPYLKFSFVLRVTLVIKCYNIYSIHFIKLLLKCILIAYIILNTN